MELKKDGGTEGRTASHHLENRVSEEPLRQNGHATLETNSYIISCLHVGEIIAISITIRHQHITDSGVFVKNVIVSDISRSRRIHFPCYSIVNSLMFLRPGNARLPSQEVFEVGRQERKLELWTRQQEYQWNRREGLPSVLKSANNKDLPQNEQILVAKYNKLPWDLNSTTENTDQLSQRHPTLANNQNQTASAAYRVMMLTGSRASMMHALKAQRLKSTKNQVIALTTMRHQRAPVSTAKKRWSKLKNCFHLLAKVATVIPDGPKGDVCRLIDDDVDFARLYLLGRNPAIFRRCDVLPEHFRVTEEKIQAYMRRGVTLQQEMKNGNIFIADYHHLFGIPCVKKHMYMRYQCAPLCLLYLRSTGDLVPIAIQLTQNPEDDTLLWTPADSREDWLLAKLWVRHADFQYQLGLHLLHCHLVMEPLVIGTFRQLSSAHPVYKLLYPHIKCIISGNIMLRKHLMNRGGNLDKWTSIGSQGFQTFLQRLNKDFTFDDLNINSELKRRGVYYNCKLRDYFYRDDALRIWDAIHQYVKDTIEFYYADDLSIRSDPEIQSWIRDVGTNGFHGRDDVELKLPKRFNTKSDVVTLLTSIIFTVTCKHSATSSEAMDIYGLDPVIPSSMMQPPPCKKGISKRMDIIAAGTRC